MVEKEDLLTRLLSLEARIERIEQWHNPKTANELNLEKINKPVESAKIPAHKDQDAEHKGGRFLGAIAVLCFLFAGSYLIKLAVESGWLTPARQLAGAVLFGLALITAGFSLKKKDAPYSSLLPGSGIVVLFMSVYGGHLGYHLYDTTAALILVAAVAFFSVYLFRIFRHDFFLFAAIVGSYLISLFLENYRANLAAVAWYFIFWDIAFCVLAVQLKRRSVIAMLSYFAIGVFFFLYSEQFSNSFEALQLTAAFEALQFALLAVAVGLYSVIHRAQLSKAEASALFPALIFFYVIEYALVEKLYPETAPWIALLFAGAVYCIYFWSKRALQTSSLNSFPLVSGFVAVVFFHAFYLNILPEAFCPWLGILLLVTIPRQRKMGISFQETGLAALSLGAVIVLEYCRVLSIVDNTHENSYLVFNLLFAGIFLFAYFSRPVAGSDSTPFSLILFASIQALYGLKRIAEFFVAQESAMFYVSGLWACYALAILITAKTLGDKALAKISLFIFALVSFKVFFYDISSQSSLTRVVALIIIGAILYSAGLILRQIESKKD